MDYSSEKNGIQDYQIKRYNNLSIAKHTTYAIVSCPDPKHWLMNQIADLVMILECNKNILKIIKAEMAQNIW